MAFRSGWRIPYRWISRHAGRTASFGMVSAWRDGGEAGVDRWLDIAAASFGPRWRNPVGEFQGGSFVPAATLQRPLWLRQCGRRGGAGFLRGAGAGTTGVLWGPVPERRSSPGLGLPPSETALASAGVVARGEGRRSRPGRYGFAGGLFGGAAVEAAAFRDCGWDMAASGDGLRPVAAKKSH